MDELNPSVNEPLAEDSLTEVKSKILDQIKRELAQTTNAKVMSFDKSDLSDLPDIATEAHNRYQSSPY